jgi:hypothetical protein
MNDHPPNDIDTKGQSAAPYLAGSIFMEGWGSKGAKPRPFNYHLAVRAVPPLGVRGGDDPRQRGGGRAPADVRAAAVRGAAQGVRDAAGGRATLRYLSGRAEMKPSAGVSAKVVAWGYDVEEVVEPHPADGAAGRPNEDDNGYEMTVRSSSTSRLTGNSYHYVVDGRGGRAGDAVVDAPAVDARHPQREADGVGGASRGTCTARTRPTR